jgi:hypothetical protein
MPARRPFVTRGGTGRPRPEARGLRLRGMRHDHASRCTPLAPAHPSVAHAVLRCTVGTLRVSSRAWSTAAEASRIAARAFALSRCVRARHCSVQRRVQTRLLTRCVPVFRRAARSESSRTLTPTCRPRSSQPSSKLSRQTFSSVTRLADRSAVCLMRARLPKPDYISQSPLPPPPLPP